MGKRVARVLMGVVVAGAMLATSPVRVEAQLATQPFAAYGNAAAVALNALAVGTTQVANTQVANSGGVVNSTGPLPHRQQPVRPGRPAAPAAARTPTAVVAASRSAC